MRDLPEIPESIRGKIYDAEQRRTRGRYSPGGRVEIMLPGMSQEATLESTVIHENTHRYLFGSTTFGFVQQTLYFVAHEHTAVPPHLNGIARDLLDVAERESLFVHEGAATFRQYEWIRLTISQDAAEAYVGGMNNFYRSACAAFRTAVNDAAISILTPSAVGLLLAEAALNTTIWNVFPEFLSHGTATVAAAMTNDSPNRRFQRISERLAQEPYLKEIEEKLRDKHETHPFPERSVEYADAWAILLKEIDACCNLTVYGSDEYPIVFRREIQSVVDALERERKQLQLNGFSFALNLVPEAHDEAWDWALEREAQIHYVPDEFPLLNRAFDEEDPKNLLLWCFHYLEEMGPQTIFYIHVFLPERLLKLPIDREYEEDADHVIIIRPYAPNHSATTSDELIVRVKGGAIPELVAHPLLSGRVAISAALHDVFSDLAPPQDDRESHADAEIRALAVEKLTDSNHVFLYPRAGTTNDIIELASGLAARTDVQWSVIRSDHWSTTLMVLSQVDSKYLIMIHCSELSVMRFREWAQEQSTSIRGVNAEVLVEGIPPHVLGTFCSHFIRFGY
ncbi:MAG TPA: hypothetical protein VGB24_13825 [Longimicrobium sp.]|jgi:hypothetical protein|uniref:hypothetical protein n=1 Tax=Longimicrobium sp. TaxID=2029185 RepID=UPI002EDA39EF